MSDFPRGWTLSSDVGPGSTASVTVPAIAGVVHVLDAFSAKILGTTAASGLITLSSSDGVFAGMALGSLNSAAGGTDSASESGLDLAAGPGASLTITFSIATPAGDNELLIVQGHDI